MGLCFSFGRGTVAAASGATGGIATGLIAAGWIGCLQGSVCSV